MRKRKIKHQHKTLGRINRAMRRGCYQPPVNASRSMGLSIEMLQWAAGVGDRLAGGR